MTVKIETVQAYISKLGADKSNTQLMADIANFLATEPHFVSMLSIYTNSTKQEDPLAVALHSLAMYKKLRAQQDESDRLGEQMK